MIVPRFRPHLLIVFLLVFAGGCARLSGPQATVRPGTDYRIYDTRAERYIDLGTLSDRITSADVVFFGELHDDAIAHRLQYDLLRQLMRDSTWNVLGLEMFERDVQPILDRHFTTRGDRGEIPTEARPWSNYETDYRPVTEAAADAGWRVVGTNVPQTLARAVAQNGIEALRTLDLDTRRHAAADFQCPEDDYWRRFLDAMSESASTDSTVHMESVPVLRRTYQAQCLRDETMAETIADLLPEERVYHLNGAFHTDFRLGIVPRLLRRAPDTEIVVISTVQVEDPRNPAVDEHEGRADFIVFTRKPE